MRLAINPQRLFATSQGFQLAGYFPQGLVSADPETRQGGDRFVNDERFKIFTGTANPVLAESICRHLDVPLGKAKLGRFSDGEIHFQILENVRGADVFVVSLAAIRWTTTCSNFC